MTNTSKILRGRIAKILLLLYGILIVVSVLINYAAPKKTLETELKKSFENDAKSIAKQFENYLRFVNDILLSYSLNREVSRIFLLPPEEAKNIDNIASYEIILSSLKDAAKRLNGDIYLNVKDIYLSVSKQGKVGEEKFETIDLNKIITLEADVPLTLFSDKNNLVFEMPILNFMTFNKIGNIFFVINKGNLMENVLRDFNNYQIAIKVNNGGVLIEEGKFRDDQFVCTNTVYDGVFSVEVGSSKSYIFRSINFVRWLFLLFTLIAIISVIGLSIFVSDFIVNPLKGLEQLFRKVKQKDLDIDSRISEINDEIDQIYDIFLKILTSLKNPIMYFSQIANNPNMSLNAFEEVIKKSERINKNISEKSNEFIESLRIQTDCLKFINEDMSEYVKNLEDIKTYLLNQSDKLKSLIDLCNLFKTEVGKIKGHTFEINKILSHYNNTIRNLDAKIKDLLKLSDYSERLVKGLRMIQISVKIELTKKESVKFIDIPSFEKLITEIEDMLVRFRNTLKSIEDMNQIVISEIWNIDSNLKKDEELSVQFSVALNKMQNNMVFVNQKIVEIVNEINMLRSKIEEVNKEISLDITKLNYARDNIQQILSDCILIRKNIEQTIDEISNIQQLTEEIKEYVSAYRI